MKRRVNGERDRWMDERRKRGMRGGIDGGVEWTKTFHTQIEATRYLDKVVLYMAIDVLIQVGIEQRK